jgi:hypothetical protein
LTNETNASVSGTRRLEWWSTRKIAKLVARSSTRWCPGRFAFALLAALVNVFVLLHVKRYIEPWQAIAQAFAKGGGGTISIMHWVVAAGGRDQREELVGLLVISQLIRDVVYEDIIFCYSIEVLYHKKLLNRFGASDSRQQIYSAT